MPRFAPAEHGEDLRWRRTRTRAWLLALGLMGACSDPSPELTVRVMYPSGGLGDNSFSDTVYEGIRRAKLKTELIAVEDAPADATEAAALFLSWTAVPARGHELVFLVGSPYASLLTSVSCELGGRWVVGLDLADLGCAQAASIEYSTFAPSFLAGVAAMAVSQRHQAAIIGGRNIETVNRFMRGFAAGVRYAGGTVVAIEYLADDESGFSDPTSAHDLATRLYAEADVVFPVAGGSGTGVISAAAEGSGRYTLGVDSDQSWLGRGVVIASVVKRLDLSVEARIDDAAAGRFTPGATRIGFEQSGVGLAVNDLFAATVDGVVANAIPAALAAEREDSPTERAP